MLGSPAKVSLSHSISITALLLVPSILNFLNSFTMAFLTSLALLQAIQLATAAPAPVFEISKRQDPSGTVDACKGSDCADCPLYFSTGTGYPECTYYDTQQLKDKGYPSDENGMVDVFFSAPPLVISTEGAAGVFWSFKVLLVLP